jgi:hypothetical protein
VRRAVAALVVAAAALVGCGDEGPEDIDDDAAPATTFEPADCGGVTDADVTDAVGSTLFSRVVVSEAGCFWQENTAIGTFGIGMGISTWWYRGSDLDTERTLEEKVGRDLVELSVDGNKGFKAFDENACSVYVASGDDVITWSIQTVNPAMLPDLCTVAEKLAGLSQDRLN